MEESQENFNPIEGNKEEKNNEDQFLSNVFSKLGNFDKNKRYRQLQKDLNLLKQDVRLMEEFSNNKDKLTNKKKIFSKRLSIINNDKDNNYKRNVARRLNSIYMRKNMNLMDKSNNSSTSNLNSIEGEENNNNYNRNIFKNINKKYKDNKKIHINKSNNLTRQKYQINFNNNNKKLIYKTEVNNYNNLINGYKLPNIYSDKVSESNLDNKNTNANSSSRLPLIQDRSIKSSKKRVYLLTDNDTDNNTSNDEINYKKNKRVYSVKKSLKDNIFIQKFPSILSSRRSNNPNINHKEFPIQTDKILRKMKEKNAKIKNRINYKISEQNLIDWEMKSKFKLAQWKYGIADVQKYFIDLQEYGKPEEVELIKRKTFYDMVEELIDDIKKTKEEKELKAIEDKYNINNRDKNKFGNVKKKQDKKKEDKNNDINAVDNTINKKVELSEVLKKVKLRKIKEEEMRNIINNIMFKSDLKRKIINDSTNKIKNKRNNLLNKSSDSYKNNISKKSNDNDKSKDESDNDKSNDMEP